MAGQDHLELARIPDEITYVHCMRKPPFEAPVLEATLIERLKRFGYIVAPLGPSGFPVAYLNNLTLEDDAKAWDGIKWWKKTAPRAVQLVVVWTEGGKRSLRIYDVVRHKLSLGFHGIGATTAKEDGVALARTVHLFLAQGLVRG